jgi:signal transduction histidine kinase
LRESVDRLRTEIEELRASRERLVRAADAERSRIERELHDGPQQHLVGLAVNLQHARKLIERDPVAACSLLDEMTRDLHTALDETRALALRIYPPLLAPGGLRLALRTAAETAGFPTDIQIADGVGYSPEVAAAIYFCCIAALDQFGTEARSAVTVSEEAGEITFEIVRHDSGCAAAPDIARERERLEAFGGRLAVGVDESGRIRVHGSCPAS